MIIKVWKIILKGVQDLSKTWWVLLFKSETAKFLSAHVLFIEQENIHCSITEKNF